MFSLCEIAKAYADLNAMLLSIDFLTVDPAGEIVQWRLVLLSATMFFSMLKRRTSSSGTDHLQGNCKIKRLGHPLFAKTL